MSLTRTKESAGRVLSVKPNWSRAVTESYEFQTRIWESRDKSQQRVCQRLHPRVSVSLRSDQMNGRMRAVYRDLQSVTEGEPQVFAARWRTAPVDGDLLAGAAAVPLVDAAPWWVAVGGWLVVESDDAIEAVEVAGVSGSTVTIEGTLALDHTGRIRAYLGLYGYPRERSRLDVAISPHSSGTVQFEAKPGFLGAAKPADSDPIFYKGIAVMPFRPNWSERVKLTILDNRESVDFSYGRTDEYFYLNQIGLTTSWLFTGKTKAEADEILAFFFARRGRQRPFWAYSHMRDFELTANAAENSTALAVEGDYTPFHEDAVHKAVLVRWPDGARQINSIVSAGDGSITVSEGWAREVTPDATISWAYVACFGSDILEIDWQTDGVAQINMAIQAIPGPPTEAIIGGALQVQFTYGGFDAADWDSPQGDLWGQIDLGSELTEEDVATGRGTASATYEGVMVWAPGLTIYNGRVNVGFFNSTGDVVGVVGDWEFSGPRAEGNVDNPFSVSFGPVAVPVGTRYVRFGGLTFQGSEEIVGVGYVSVARILDGGVLF